MERLTNIGSNGEIWITDNDETRRFGRKETAYKKLAEYEDLTERLNGVSVKQVVDGFINTVENQTNEEYEHGRILTNAEADKWNEYKQLEEQGLLLRLPCGIGADVYFIPSEVNYKLNILQGYPESNRVYHQNVERITFTPNGWYLECDKDIEYATDHILIDKLYKETWFLTQAEAEQKLKEVERIDMTIDEAIAFCHEKSNNIKLKAEPQVFIQIAEWLEELKAYREIGTVEECRNSVLNIPKAYNKAIDECLSILYRNAGKIISIRFYEEIFNEMEKLKAGGENA